jgi:peptidoglycan/LPS O-acetylase OafA/YrhL
MKRLPQLDGVRGIAILLVLFHNTSPLGALHLSALSTYGWMGVDLFFVLSGFLITGILLETKESEGYFRNFYARRILRIWPLYYSLLIFMFVIVPRFDPLQAHAILERSSPRWSYLFFLQNFFVGIPAEAAGALGVTWSLAIEEQFYLIWPLIVRCFSSSQLKRIAVTVILLSPPLRYFLGFHHVDIYSNFFCRLDGLMAGALLAMLVRSKTSVPGKNLAVAGFSLLAAITAAITAEHYDARWFTFSMTSWAAFSLIYLALFSSSAWAQSILRNRFLTYTGTISYGLYLLHKIPFDVSKTAHWGPVFSFCWTVALSYLLAAISWTLLEKPFLKLKRFFDRKSSGSGWVNSPPVELPT